MDNTALNILQLLIFPERFESIVAESDADIDRHIAGDILKQLLHDEYVSPLIEEPEGTFTRSLGYDSDHLEDFCYQITAKGLRILEKQI